MASQFRKRVGMAVNTRFPFLRDARLNVRRFLHSPERAVRGVTVADGEICPRLKIYGAKVYSQNDEDGVIDYLFSRIPKREPYFVEIGVGPPWRGSGVDLGPDEGLECNCRHLVEQGWRGLFIDGNSHPPEFNVKQEFVTAENINELLRKYSVPAKFDLFSLDIDGNDYWVWEALDYQPSVVIVEYNAAIAMSESKTIPYEPNFSWAQHGATEYYGASLLALKNLGERKGYVLVYANGTNAFFVLNEFVPNHDDFDYERLYVGKSRHREMKGNEIWQAV